MPVRGRSDAITVETASAVSRAGSTEKDESHSYFGGELAACLAAMNLPATPPPPDSPSNARAHTDAAAGGVSSRNKSLTRELCSGEIGAVAEQQAAGENSGPRGVFGSEQSASRFGQTSGPEERADQVAEQAVVGGNGLGDKPFLRASVAAASEAADTQYAAASPGSAATPGSPPSASKLTADSPAPAAQELKPGSEPSDYRGRGAFGSEQSASKFGQTSGPEERAEQAVVGGNGLGDKPFLHASVAAASEAADTQYAAASPGSAATPGSPPSVSKLRADSPAPAAQELKPGSEASDYRGRGAQEKQTDQRATGMADDAVNEPARHGLLQWPTTKTGKGSTERAGPTSQSNLNARADASKQHFGNSVVGNVLPNGSASIVNGEANTATGRLHGASAVQETGIYNLAVGPRPVPEQPKPENAATLKVELEIGGSVRANIREHLGTVEVRMMTGDSQAARGLTGEADGLRSALGNSGLKLQSFEVSYQNDQRQRRPNQQLAADSRRQHSNDEAEIFSIAESKQ